MIARSPGGPDGPDGKSRLMITRLILTEKISFLSGAAYAQPDVRPTCNSESSGRPVVVLTDATASTRALARDRAVESTSYVTRRTLPSRESRKNNTPA